MDLSIGRLATSLLDRFNRCRYRVTGKRVVHLIHIGKTGGTAIKDALNPVRILDEHMLVLHSHKTKLGDIRKGDRFMFFLRNPISRYVSGFYSRQRQGQPRRFSPWNTSEEKAFSIFSTPNSLALALSSGDPVLRGSAIEAMRGIRHVKDFYWDWFGCEEALTSRKDDLFFIGFQESLTADFNKLSKKLNLPADVTLPSDPVRCHKNPSHLDYHLDDEAILNLKTWYKKDLEFIDFCKTLQTSVNN